MKRRLTLVFALCSALPAASGLKVLPLDKSIVGIAVMGPNDPGFQARAASLIPADKMAAAAPYLAESIIVTNNSGQAIMGLGIRFTNTISNGRPIQNGQFLGEDSFWKPILAVGEQRIVTRGGTVIQNLIAGKPPRQPPATPQNPAVSIDLVIYADWLVAGPDEMQSLPRHLSEMHADQDVCTQLGTGTPNPTIVSLLAQEASVVVQPPPPKSTDWYAWEFQRMAERISASLRDGNTNLPQVWCAPVLTASGVATALHRAQP